MHLKRKIFGRNKKLNKCPKCDKAISKDDKFCPNCGYKLTSEDKEAINFDEIARKASKTVEKVLDTDDHTKSYTKKDINDNRAMAILAYFGPLALLPYFGQKNSKYARFHAVNGMNLFVWEIAYWFLYSFDLFYFSSGWSNPTVCKVAD